MGMKWLVVPMVAGLTVFAGCDRAQDDNAMDFNGDGMEQARAGWPAELSARIDSGNVAYREGRYDDAAEIYRSATELSPDVAAGWFGLHMAEAARGNDAAADSARMMAESLTPGLGMGHPQTPMGDAPAGDMPAGHPPIDGGTTPEY
jgi:tetratricopeptide (TPR) repeat protein